MRFCHECNNLLYPFADHTKKVLVYKCKRCKYVEKAEEYCVYTNNITSETASAAALVNRDMIRDPTLSRDYTTECSACGHQESVYMNFPTRNPDEAMKLMHICTQEACGHYWKD